jgi:simple sugar transport system permease protein
VRDKLARAGVEVGLSVAVAAAALAVSMLVVAASGASAGDTISTFYTGAFGSSDAIGSTIQKMVPLVLVALAWIVVFSGGRFHVGFPGQILIGGALSTVVALKLSGLPGVLHLPLAVVAGIIGGALYASIAAWMWARRGVNELLSTLLLNLVAIQVIAWLVRGPLQEPGKTLPQTDFIKDSGLWPALPGQIFIHWDVVLIPVCVVVVAAVLMRTSFGFRLRLTGDNDSTARHAGVSPKRIGVQAIVASGALAGLAGASLILSGETRAMSDNFDAGYGYQGIAVALLARNSPIGAIPAALMFAALAQGGGVVEAQVGVSSAVVGLTQGLVIVFVLAAGGLLYARRRRSTGGPPAAGTAGAEA